MRVSNTPRRHSRSRNNPGRRNNNSPNNPYDSNKDSKIKGNAVQVHERYQSMARDAITSGDIVQAEYYFQHAEHYHRVHKSALNSQLERQQQNEKNIVPINTEKDNKQPLAENNIAEKTSDITINKENKKQPLKNNNIIKTNSEKISDTSLNKEDNRKKIKKPISDIQNQ